VFVNKLTEASIQSNNDLSEAFTLNGLKLLLLSITFSQINVLNSNAYILAGHIQGRLNKINVKVLIDLDTDQIYIFLTVINQMLIDSQYEIESLKISLLNRQAI